MNIKRTIVHLRASNFVGGPEKQIIEHLKRLNQNRYNGWLVSFLEGRKENEMLQVARREGLNNCAIPTACPIDGRSLFKLLKLIRQLEADLICVHGYKACVMGWWVGKKANIPVLAFSRGDTGENRKVVFYEWLERRFLAKLEGIIAVSEGQKRLLEAKGLRKKNIWVVQNAIAIDAHALELSSERKIEVFHQFGIPQAAKLVVSAGRLSPEKGHRYLLEAIARLKKEERKYYFMFCGEGPCRADLEKQSEGLGISDQCHFPGFSRALPEILSAMDLLVLPSLSEGLPNVVLEAFASGKPVVASAVGGVPEIVANEVNGLLVPPQRPDLLSAAIDRILSNPELGKTMGLAGYSKVKSSFTFEAQTEQLEERYNQILSSSGGMKP
jgi:glycosyltransferase involved in cell wall biosynthesis